MIFLERIIIVMLLLLSGLFVFSPPIYAVTPTPLQVTLSTTSIPTYGIIEFTFASPESYSNPYDMEIVNAFAVITTPQGTTENTTAFWQETVNISSSGSDRYTVAPNSGKWKVRYAPSKVGSYKVRVVVQDPNSSYQSTSYDFTATASNNKGYIKADPQNKTRFVYDNGEAYVMVGINLAWSGSSNDFENYFITLKQNKLNFARIWMSYIPDPNFLLEWSGTANKDNNALSWGGLGKYNQEVAYKIDKMLEAADRNDTKVMLTTFTYQYFFDWNSTNPYASTLSGGDPRTIWTSPSARKHYKNYIRYIAARYGAYTSLGMIEMWNELDKQEVYPGLLPNGNQVMGEWHQLMVDTIDTASSRKPLTTTSFSGYAKKGTDGTGTKSYTSIPSVDVTQAHHYDSGSYASNMLQAWHEMGRWANQTFNRPWFIGEYGYHGFDCYKQTIAGKCSDNATLNVQLEQLNHHSTWVPIMLSGASGSNLLWRVNWGFLPPPEFLANYKRFGTWIESETAYLPQMQFNFGGDTLPGYWVGEYKSSNRAIAYFLNKSAKWTTLNTDSSLTTIANATHTFAGMTNTTYTIQYTNPYTGALLSSTTTTPSNGTITLQLPSFKRDLAVKVFAQSGQPSTTAPSPTLTNTPTPSITIRKPGDATGDGIINVQDYNILVTQFNQSGSNLSADFNTSGKVDVQDYNILVTNFGK
jgi:hypothetical protein